MENNKKFYTGTQNMLSKSYESLKLEDYAYQIDEMLSRLDRLPKSALELGAGIGLAAINLDKHGVSVTAIDFEQSVYNIALKNKKHYSSRVNFIHDDIYDFHPTEPFNLIYYLDGFGIGNDSDQLKLLRNISEWLDDEGCAYIEIYNPNHWRKAEGIQMKLTDTVHRKYHFDEENQLMIDVWTNQVTDQSYTQTLKCYLPKELEQLAKQAGLHIQNIFPNGKMNYEKMEYISEASLEECMSYAVVLRK